MTMSNTQQQAKASVKTSVSKRMRARVFETILNRGGEGATNEEIAHLLDMRVQTVCARKNELFKKHLVVDSGVRRPTESGRSASVWVVPSEVVSMMKSRSDLNG